jgi:hypothetical protein
MENNQKPEWFELADNDQPVSRKFKNKVTAPKRNLALIVAGILVLPMGAGFALLSHEDQSASAVETLNMTQDSPVATTSTPAETGNVIAMPSASREDSHESEGEDDNYRAPVFSNSVSSSAPVVTPAAAQSNQNTPEAIPSATKSPTATVPTAKASAAAAPTAKASVAITPPGSSTSTKELILPPTKKTGDDDENEHKVKGEGKKSKKLELSVEEDDDEEDGD